MSRYPRHTLGRSGAVGRRGISPLIATVLLLAFAVAIGTMAVSYILEAMRSGPCDNVVIAAQEGVPVCYRNDAVTVILTNRAADPDDPIIFNAMLKFVDSRGGFTETKVPLAISPGGGQSVTVPYRSIAPETTTLFIVPTVMTQDGEKFCNNREISTPIQVCG
jgi:flagellin-like protein